MAWTWIVETSSPCPQNRMPEIRWVWNTHVVVLFAVSVIASHFPAATRYKHAIILSVGRLYKTARPQKWGSCSTTTRARCEVNQDTKTLQIPVLLLVPVPRRHRSQQSTVRGRPVRTSYLIYTN
jgi:hypothetical protein